MTRRKSSATGRRDSYHVGLDADKVIDAAVELSRGAGLAAWSLRDLGERLGVGPAETEREGLGYGERPSV